jgi:hypothetical protein
MLPSTRSGPWLPEDPSGQPLDLQAMQLLAWVSPVIRIEHGAWGMGHREIPLPYGVLSNQKPNRTAFGFGWIVNRAQKQESLPPQGNRLFVNPGDGMPIKIAPNQTG